MADADRRLVGLPAGEQPDARVAVVLEVLAGEPVDRVAERWAVAPALVERWTRAFVEAGTAQVTNRPVGDLAHQRDRFLSTFMYGLRAPLAVAQMWVGLVRDVRDDPVTTTEMIDRLGDSLDLLDERALDVELLTAAMLGRLNLRPQTVTVGELVGGMDGGTVGGTVGGMGGGLVGPEAADVDGDTDLELQVDRPLFSRVLRDLWQAAAQAAPGADHVRLQVGRVAPWVELRVVRTGAPIDPAVLHALFEPFEERDDSTRVTVGLYLARALTVVHGGTVGVDQDHHGTTFWVRVPDHRPALLAAPEPSLPTLEGATR